MGVSARKPVARAGLERGTILAAAERLLRREGLEGFSMRKLARPLGTTAMALYRYFPNKDALLDALVDRQMEGLEVPSARRSPWQTRARLLAVGYRARLLALPEAIPWVLRRATVSPGALRHYDAALSAARDSGLPDAEVVRVVDAMVSFVLGFVAIEAARLGVPASGRGYRALVPLFLRLPARDFPALVALAPHAGDFDDALFEFGLDLLLDGATARAGHLRPRRSSRKPGPRLRG